MSQGERRWRAGTPRISVRDVGKTFTIHARGGVELPVIDAASFEVAGGECVALTGVSGAGKSTLMRILYGNYRAGAGSVWVNGADDGVADGVDWVDLAAAEPHVVLELRRRTIGYVSQFLSVIPRVATIDVVAEPLIAAGAETAPSLDQARAALARLRIPERLWSLSPLTFSGGERQRVNIARGLIHPYPCLLLDEPTASLDRANRETVFEMIEEARDGGAAIIGIFHDAEARDRLCNRLIDVSAFTAAA